MKKAKRWFATALAVVMVVSSLCSVAMAGPPQVDLTANMEAGAQFACETIDGLTLTLNNAEGTSFVLTQDDKQITCTAEYEEATEGKFPGVKGIAHLSHLNVTGADDMDALRVMCSGLWTGSFRLMDKDTSGNSAAPTFQIITDVAAAAVDFTTESVKNADSVTGYSAVIKVNDPDKSYTSVYVCGKWKCSYPDDEDGTIYELEQWEDGMYQNAEEYDIRALSYDDKAKAWSVSLDMPSAFVDVKCFANVTEDDLAGGSVSNKIFDEVVLSGYDAEKQSKSFDWSNFVACEQAGTLTTVKVSDDIKLRVYTPYCYNAADTTTRYPVVYLIAGMNASFDSWLDGGCYTNILFDNLIADGTVAPTILVAMERNAARMDYNDIWDSADSKSKQNGDGDGYINYVDGAAKGSDIENMISSPVVTTVIPYIDANYNTAADAEHRAVIGCSMGGVAASQIWLTDYEMFDFYGFFSGSDNWFKTADDENADPEYKDLRDTYTTAYTALLDNVAANMDGAKILVGGGITDRNTFGGDQNSSGSDNISAWMTEAGIAHDFKVVGGGHDWVSWRQLMNHFTGYLAEDGTTWTVAKVDKTEVPAETDAQTYVVKSGDCMWSIAAKLLGNGAKWNEIYQANKAVINDPNLIFAGQILTVPNK